MTFQQAMAATSRELNARATITCVDAFVISNTPVMSFSVEEGGQVTLGSVTSSRYTLSLPNSGGEWLKNGSILGNRSLIGARVQIQIGVYHDGAWDWQNAGLFIVEKTSAPEFSATIKLIGNDPLILLDVAYGADITYRNNTTLNDILTHIRSKGFTINGTLATNGESVINFTPDWGDEPTVREVLGYVAQICGSFVRCDRSGNIELVPANSSTTHTITTDRYLEFTDDERYFNFNRIKVLPYGAKKSESHVQAYVTSAAESAANTIVIEGNPLFKTKSTTTYSKATTWREGGRYYVRIDNKYTYVENPIETSLSSYYVANTTRNTTNLQAMVNNLKTALTGMSFRALNFTWRGNPQVMVGDKVAIVDTRGVTTTTVNLQQTLRFDRGFKSEISCPLDLQAVYPSTITSSGRVVPPYFGEGSIDGSVIVPESITGDLVVAGGITAERIASKTITADEIAAKTITADEIAAKTITADEIAAGTITATEIGASQITATHIGTNEIVANAANIKDGVITNAKIANATIETAKIKDAAITTAKIQDAQITNAKIAAAGIDFANIKDLISGTAIITEGMGGQLYIARLAVTEANMVSLTVGELMLRTSSGGFVRLIADGQGGVTTQPVLVAGSNVAESTIGGGKLIENTITARELNVASIFADTALIRAIKAANIDVADLFAAQATIDELNAVDIRGNEYLQLAVGDIKVGGANLLLNSDFQQETISPWIKNSGSTLAYLYPDDATYNFEGKRSLCLKMPASGEASGYIYQEIAGLDVLSDYVFSFYYYITSACKTLFGSSAFAAIQQLDANGSSISISRVLAESIAAGEWSRCVVPVTLDAACKKIRVYFYIATTVGQENQWFINNSQFEKGNKETQWRLSDKDPVQGLKNSSVRIDEDGIFMDTTGEFSTNAAIAYNVRGGSGANAIGISNNELNNHFLWAGNSSPALAPFSVKMDGSVKATKIQQEYSNSFWDMADASVPAEFPVYIPSGYTIDSVEFTFQTKKARTFAKSASSKTVAYSTQASSSYVTGSASPTDPHSHSIGTHTHVIPSQSHGHSLNYGINEKSALATSCALKVGTTTIGTYSPDPSSPVELKAYMSAGWNTVIVAPDNDARIVAYAMVKVTPT